MAKQESWGPNWHRVVHALWELVSHTLIMTVMLSCIWCTEGVISYLWGSGKTLWGQVPISWIFDSADAVAIIAFLVLGIVGAVRVYRAGD